MLRNVILSTLAGTGAVLAAGVCDNDVKIAAQADIDALASCSILSQDVTINASNGLQTINLDKITNIRGALSISGANITSISMGTLAVIGGVFTMSTLDSLGSVLMPDLINVGGIAFGPIGPSLQTLGFTKGISTVTGDVIITDTYLDTLAGINLMTVGTFNINNNRYLSSITQQLHNATKAIIIQANAQDVAASFPNLAWVPEATFQQVANLSMPALQHVNGSLGCTNNTFAAFAAPKLSAIEKDLIFINGANLASLSFPILESLGGSLTITNNTDLLTIDGFPVLKTVDGSITFIGSFNNASVPSISDVRGSFLVDTTSTTFSCDAITAYGGNQVKGQDKCTNGDANANSNTASGTGTSGAAGSTSTPKKSAGVHSSSINIAGAVVLAAVLGFLAL